MHEARGREARLRPDFDYLYPEIEPGVWLPVELMINRVAALLYGAQPKSGELAGTRLLRDDHFEFRGASPRPAGVPPELSRLSDAGLEPERAARELDARRTRPKP